MPASRTAAANRAQVSRERRGLFMCVTQVWGEVCGGGREGAGGGGREVRGGSEVGRRWERRSGRRKGRGRGQGRGRMSKWTRRAEAWEAEGMAAGAAPAGSVVGVSAAEAGMAAGAEEEIPFARAAELGGTTGAVIGGGAVAAVAVGAPLAALAASAASAARGTAEKRAAGAAGAMEAAEAEEGTDASEIAVAAGAGGTSLRRASRASAEPELQRLRLMLATRRMTAAAQRRSWPRASA